VVEINTVSRVHSGNRCVYQSCGRIHCLHLQRTMEIIGRNGRTEARQADRLLFTLLLSVASHSDTHMNRVPWRSVQVSVRSHIINKMNNFCPCRPSVRPVRYTVRVLLLLASSPGLLDLFCGAGNFGNTWSVCGQHEIQYTVWRTIYGTATRRTISPVSVSIHHVQ